jgi:hypothetical protein
MGQNERAELAPKAAETLITLPLRAVDWRAEDAIERDPLGALDALDRAWFEYWHAAVAGLMNTDGKRQALWALRDEMGLRHLSRLLDQEKGPDGV